MLVNVQKRTLICRVLPKTGTLDGQIRTKELEQRLKNLSDEYKTKIEFVENEDGTFSYNPSQDELEEFELSESEKHVLKRGVEALDKQENITFDILDLCIEIKNL